LLTFFKGDRVEAISFGIYGSSDTELIPLNFIFRLLSFWFIIEIGSGN
jgi:hypothetical protein